MMRDEDGIETEMTTSEVINQLYQDNKALEHYINILQSKINRAIEYCEYNDEDLYTFEPDYDYEENMVDNYEPSSFRENIMEILKEVEENE